MITEFPVLSTDLANTLTCKQKFVVLTFSPLYAPPPQQVKISVHQTQSMQQHDNDQGVIVILLLAMTYYRTETIR